ncbi:hypothetical protein F5148DRAFT_1286177 [Russula earlei]|uniref:Uncharacterized protein n=1 Tax=Russula earlei TaxID=71964 RepID=A0ACC0U5J0_9AGAM|nr:hypothetical protein F5148DRAFT_1286177 [Russula earlei]
MIVTGILYLLPGIVGGQTTKALAEKADSCYMAKDYAHAAGYYTHLSRQVDFHIIKRGGYFQAACCYAQLGNTDSAVALLYRAIGNGFKDIDHLLGDADLIPLHPLPVWDSLVTTVQKASTCTGDPDKVRLITRDVQNFWAAYDLAKKHPAHRSAIYKKYYLDAGTDGLQDYFAYKIGSIKDFTDIHDCKPRFYAAIRKNSLAVDEQKPQMISGFIRLKELYPPTRFPDIYFVMGCFSSAGTATDNGLLIGVDQVVATPDIPIEELSLWQRNNFTRLDDLPSLVIHELVHFNQTELCDTDTTLLRSVLIEGMADFIAELATGQNPNKRLFVWAKGKEKKIWASFEKDMYFNRANNWIANSTQETVDKPADLGYWVGYQICKAYYEKSTDKRKAIYDMLHIQDYKDFYYKSGAAALFK